MNHDTSFYAIRPITTCAGIFLTSLFAVNPVGADETVAELPALSVEAQRVAIKEPAGVSAQPVSLLRYEPAVDVQARNMAEGQGDVSIRGGIFENTGFKFGAITIFDPQTGHYFAELPVAPGMLLEPAVTTGSGNSLRGFNSTAGTLEFGWRPITQRGEIGAFVGDHGLNRQYAYGGMVSPSEEIGGQIGVDAEYARSEGHGTRPGGDHDFERFSARIQFQMERAQTDFFFGYQDKFFGWPYLYAIEELHSAVGSSGLETEQLKTRLTFVNHRIEMGDGDFLEVSAYHRRNTDDYEFDRTSPGLFNAYEHETEVYSAGFQGRKSFDVFSLNFGGQFVADEIDSSALTFGEFESRSYYKLSAVPQITRELDNDRAVTLSAGVTFDDTNRNGSEFSPLAMIALEESLGENSANRYYAEYSEATQVAGYTAIASNPAGGLFRGNQSLDRETSRNYEIGAHFVRPGWQARAAVFYRQDDDLVDWTVDLSSLFARAASNVDIDTLGFEALVSRNWDAFEVVLGYTYLTKDEDYGTAAVDASFYALNYANHRGTAALIYRPMANVTLRADNEFRDQEENALRKGSDQTVISSFSISWQPTFVEGLELTGAIDNIFKSNFEEVPGVPGAGRQFSVGAIWRF